MSILVFYIRIFTLHVFWFKVVVLSTIAYTTGWMISILVYVPIQWYYLLLVPWYKCLQSSSRPASFFWERYLPVPPAGGVCPYDRSAPLIATSALNSVGDFAVLLMPIIVLHSLQLKTRKKMALLSVFFVGVL